MPNQGKSQRGEMNHQHHLTGEQVLEIRRRRKQGELLRVLAAEYHTTTATISRVAARKQWAWLRRPADGTIAYSPSDAVAVEEMARPRGGKKIRLEKRDGVRYWVVEVAESQRILRAAERANMTPQAWIARQLDAAAANAEAGARGAPVEVDGGKRDGADG